MALLQRPTTPRGAGDIFSAARRVEKIIALLCLASLALTPLDLVRVDSANLGTRRARFADREEAANGFFEIQQLVQTTKDIQYGDSEQVQTSVYCSGCSNDPKEEMTTVEMIKHLGYPVEEHFVTTEDGYILALHRIPGKKGSPVVLLHHALLESSFCWIVNGKDKSLAFILSNNGYDVWMGNVRGNTYSKKHVNLSTSDPKFWNFSWHEMGVHDLPAEINYISSITNDKLSYIGHSMGTTIFYVMASERPEIASNVNVMVGLAPVAFLNHIRGPFELFASILKRAQDYFQFDGLNEFFPFNPMFKFIAKCICTKPILKNICSGILFTIYGFNVKNFNTSTLPLILTHTPAGTSFKTILHFAQGYGSRSFRNFNYGTEKNRQIYNSEESPAYNLSRIQVPVALFSGQNDLLAQPNDVQNLFEHLPNVIGSYKMEDPQFNHLDFVWGIDASRTVYSQILRIFDRYRHTNVTFA